MMGMMGLKNLQLHNRMTLLVSNPAVISTNVSRLFYAEFSIDMTARAASYKMHLCHASLIFRITIIVQFFPVFFSISYQGKGAQSHSDL